MSLEESTFNTAQVLDNEIVKASDFTFAFDNLINNVSKMTQMVLEANQDFVINGKVLPYQGMNVKISPIYGVCFSTGQNFGSTEEQIMEYGFGESAEGRIDIIQVKGEWATYDNQQRAFNDPDTDTQTYQYVDTKKFLKPVFQIKTGEEGSSVAPEVDAGWVKLAEVVIRANNSTITEDDIKNITSDIAGLDNNGWTNQPSITYNIGYISDVNKRFREQHNEDGSHKENVIGTKEMNIGTGSNALNSNVIPIGGSVSLPNTTISTTDSILSLLNKIATFVTNLFNSYLKNGAFNFNGELALSSLVDENNTLTKALKLGANGDGSAYLKVGDSTVLTITVDGKLVTNGYTASAANQLITKAVTDSISQTIADLNQRLTQLEATTDITLYANETLSADRYSIDSSTQIYAATTQNITLSGTQTIDGQTLTSGVYILVKNQTNAKENGIYQYSSSAVWSRISAYDTPSEMIGKIWIVLNGTANGGRYFYMPKVNFKNINSFGSDDIPIKEYFATSKPKPNRIIIRDANGRAQVAAPENENDIARKAEVTALNNTLTSCRSSEKPLAQGTAAIGTSCKFARQDHVHPVTGLATIQCANGYWGLGYAGVYSSYLRAPALGFIPYCSSVNGVGSIGTSTWPFVSMYAKTFYGSLSGNATTATTATNATCFGGCTYAQACTAIRSGLLTTTGTAANSTKFGGCTYAQACTNIRSGLLATTGCAADSAKLGGQASSYYLPKYTFNYLGTTVDGVEYAEDALCAFYSNHANYSCRSNCVARHVITSCKKCSIYYTVCGYSTQGGDFCCYHICNNSDFNIIYFNFMKECSYAIGIKCKSCVYLGSYCCCCHSCFAAGVSYLRLD